MSKIHAVERLYDDNGGSLSVHTSLCGRNFISRATWFLATFSGSHSPDQVSEAVSDLQKRIIVYDNDHLPWRSVEDFCMGEEDADDIDCASCRKKMDAAITRFWQPE